jgi:hypothetical protein
VRAKGVKAQSPAALSHGRCYYVPKSPSRDGNTVPFVEANIRTILEGGRTYCAEALFLLGCGRGCGFRHSL